MESIAQAVFFGLTVVCIATAGVGLVVATGRTRFSPGAASRWFVVCVLGVALLEAILLEAVSAGVAAVMAIAVVVGLVLDLAGARSTRDAARPRRVLASALGVAVAGALFVYVLVGTLARQFLWYGRPLGADSEFGAPAALGAALAAEAPELVVLAPVLIVVVILGARLCHARA